MSGSRGGVFAIGVASGVAGAAAGCAPVGGTVVDHLLTGLTAAVVTFAAASASGFALMGAAAIVVATGGSWQLHVVGLVALFGAAATVRLHRTGRGESWLPIARAVFGALVVQAVLRLPWTSPVRGSAVVAFVALVTIALAGMLGLPRRPRRIVVAAVCVVAALAAIAALGSVYAVVRSHSQLQQAESDARAGVDAARAGDRASAADAFARSEVHFRDAERNLGSWVTWPARQLPVVGPQLRVLDAVASVGTETIPLARSSATNVDPDRLRLVDGRLDLATLASYRPIFDELARQTTKVRAELARLPRMWLLPVLDHNLTHFESTVVRADESAHTADQAVNLAPTLLGGKGVRRYFVSMVTPAEARGSGGLMANYGLLTAIDGRLHLARVGRGPDLDSAGKQPKHLTGPHDYLAVYGKFQPAETWNNVTMSPDFPSVAQVMAQLYPQSGGPQIDGVIQIDPFAMSSLLSLTGPVHLAGVPVTLTAENIVRFLFLDEYTLITDQVERSNVLGDIAQGVFDRLTSGRSAQPSRMAEALSPAIHTHDLSLWFKDPASQEFARRIGADAALPPVHGDSFGVIVQNGGGSKIENYLHRSLTYSATVSGTSGTVSAHAVVTLRNDSPKSGVPFYVIGNGLGLPAGTSRLYFSAYSPLGLRNATVDGRPLTLLREQELGRNVYSAFVDIPSGRTRTVTLDLSGPVDLSPGTYHFDYIPQVLPNADRVSWSARIVGAHVVATSARVVPPPTLGDHGRTARLDLRSARGPWSFDLQLRR